MPEALRASLHWVPILAFAAGGVLFREFDERVERLAARVGREGGPWAIFFGVAVDLFSDGIMIGTGAVVDPALGLLFALGQVPADLPEGFAAIATFKRADVPRARRVALAAALPSPCCWARRSATGRSAASPSCSSSPCSPSPPAC